MGSLVELEIERQGKGRMAIRRMSLKRLRLLDSHLTPPVRIMGSTYSGPRRLGREIGCRRLSQFCSELAERAPRVFAYLTEQLQGSEAEANASVASD